MKKIIGNITTTSGLSIEQLRGMLDYVTGFLLITMPWFFIEEASMFTLLSVMFGGTLLIVYSMFTDYRCGITYWIFKKLHTAMDLAAGIALIALSIFAMDTDMLGLLIMFTGSFIVVSTFAAELINIKLPSINMQEQEQELMLS